MDDDALPGGWISGAVRVADTVVRNPGENSAFVHALLDHLAAAVAPRDGKRIGREQPVPSAGMARVLTPRSADFPRWYQDVLA